MSLDAMASPSKPIQAPANKTAAGKKKFAVPPVKVACLAWYVSLQFLSFVMN